MDELIDAVRRLAEEKQAARGRDAVLLQWRAVAEEHSASLRYYGIDRGDGWIPEKGDTAALLTAMAELRKCLDEARELRAKGYPT